MREYSNHEWYALGIFRGNGWEWPRPSDCWRSNWRFRLHSQCCQNQKIFKARVKRTGCIGASQVVLDFMVLIPCPCPWHVGKILEMLGNLKSQQSMPIAWHIQRTDKSYFKSKSDSLNCSCIKWLTQLGGSYHWAIICARFLRIPFTG